MGESQILCAVAGQDKLLHINISRCVFVSDLRRVIIEDVGMKIPVFNMNLWKVNGTRLRNSLQDEVIRDDLKYLSEIGKRLHSHQRISGVLEEENSDGSIEIILQIKGHKKEFPSISVPERYIWCAIAGEDRLIEFDASRCKNMNRLKSTIEEDPRLDSNVLEIWKMKHPEKWSINDKIRKPIPKDSGELEGIAELLKWDNSLYVPSLFDDSVRREHISLIVVIRRQGELKEKSTERRNVVWCASLERDRVFQLDTSGCGTTRALEDAVWHASGFKNECRSLYKLSSNNVCYANNTANIHASSEDMELIRNNHRVGDITSPSEDPDTDRVYLVVETYRENHFSRKPRPERFVWCAFTGTRHIFRINIGDCASMADVRNTILRQMHLSSKIGNLAIWRVKEPKLWDIAEVEMGETAVPDDTEGLLKVADLTAVHLVEEELGESFSEDHISAFVQLPIEYNLAELSASESSHPRSSYEDDPFVDRDDIIEALRELGFDDEVHRYIERPHVADVITSEGKRFIAKYLRPGHDDEIEVIEYLSTFDSPRNHSPEGAISYRLCEGSLLFTPYYGCPARHYEHLCRDLLSIAEQLIEGVAFLHSNHVAHMDLKDSHVIIDESSKVWIVDYDLSEIIDEENPIVRGYRGTKGSTAPEVGRNAYNPFLADIWAAGNIIRRLCNVCPNHEDMDFLTTLYNKLMARQATLRPSMHEAWVEISAYSNKKRLNAVEDVEPLDQ